MVGSAESAPAAGILFRTVAEFQVAFLVGFAVKSQVEVNRESAGGLVEPEIHRALLVGHCREKLHARPGAVHRVGSPGAGIQRGHAVGFNQAAAVIEPQVDSPQERDKPACVHTEPVSYLTYPRPYPQSRACALHGNSNIIRAYENYSAPAVLSHAGKRIDIPGNLKSCPAKPVPVLPDDV